MVGSFNHLANLQNEGVTEAYFFLMKSYVANPIHNSPKTTKKRGTMLAANTSTDRPIIGVLRHSVWPIQALPIVQSTQ
jgi:hypothetical protein